MLAAYFVVSIILYILARFTPYEWHPLVFYGRREVDNNQEIVVNQFNLLNSFWFTVGSLMQQGCDITPRAISTRIISVAWWFFILIMISSYTANLAAFLTVERMKSPIETVDDLANQNKIVYGTLYGGATYNFFKDSNIDLYKRMWSQMNNFKVNAFVNETEAGIERVKIENYAFILESTWLEYHSSRNCELMQVGGLLDSKGYGIGLPRDSKIKDLLSDMILKLQDEQFLVERKDYWWKKTSHVKCSSADYKMKDANQLTVQHVGGIFIVLVVGLAISMVVAFLEYCWYARKVQIIPEGDLCKMMCKEFCQATKCLASGRRGRQPERSKKDSHKMELKRRRKSSTVPPNRRKYESLEHQLEERGLDYLESVNRPVPSIMLPSSNSVSASGPARQRRKLFHSVSVPIVQFGI